MSHVQVEDPHAVYGEDPTPDDLFYLAWGETLIRDTLPFLNAVLRQLVTLSAALTGGAIAFSDKQVMVKGYAAPVTILLLCSLAAAVWGVLPGGGTVNSNCPDEIRETVERTVRTKSRCVRTAAAFLFAALFVVVVGVVAQNP